MEEISNFGGDPSRVTIWGESAGSGSVASHLVMPNSWPLFQQGIMESGPIAYWSAKPINVYDEVTKYMLQQLGCGSSSEDDALSCLRKVDAKKLQSVPDVLKVEQSATNVTGFLWLTWAPVIDGKELSDHPLTLLRNGDFAIDKRLLMGTNKNEGSTFYPGLPTNLTEQQYLQFLQVTEGNYYAKKTLQEYPVSGYTSPWWAR